MKDISQILSRIPPHLWNRIVEREPEWISMQEFLSPYGFGRFAVLMMAAGLNDYQLKGKAEVAYWPPLRNLLRNSPVPASLSDMEKILSKFYSKERYYATKLRRLRKFLSSRLAGWMWSADPFCSKKFLGIHYHKTHQLSQLSHPARQTCLELFHQSSIPRGVT